MPHATLPTPTSQACGRPTDRAPNGFLDCRSQAVRRTPACLQQPKCETLQSKSVWQWRSRPSNRSGETHFEMSFSRTPLRAEVARLKWLHYVDRVQGAHDFGNKLDFTSRSQFTADRTARARTASIPRRNHVARQRRGAVLSRWKNAVMSGLDSVGQQRVVSLGGR